LKGRSDGKHEIEVERGRGKKRIKMESGRWVGIEMLPTFYIQSDFSIFDVLLLLIYFFVQYSTLRYACHGREIRFGFIEIRVRIRSACDPYH